MSLIRLILRSLFFHGRIHLVVILSSMTAAAVIVGALCVGDSMKTSLRRMTLERLGRVSHAMPAGRMVREELADLLSVTPEVTEHFSAIAPALLMPATVESSELDGVARRAAGVEITGLDGRLWALLNAGDVAAPSETGIVVGAALAADLQLSVGDQLTVRVELPSSIPRDSLLGERDEVTRDLVLTVEAVLTESDGPSRFSMRPGQQLPRNAFVSLDTLQDRLGLAEVVVSRRNPVAKPAKINALFAATDVRVTAEDRRDDSETDAANADAINAAFKRRMTLVDLGARLRPDEERGYVSLESDRMIVESAVSNAAIKAADSLGLNVAPSMVYLVNEISAADRATPDERFSMYSVAGAIPFDKPAPFGPIETVDGTAIVTLASDEVLLTDWLQEDLQVAAGDTIELSWFGPESHGQDPPITKRFTVKGIVAMDNPVTGDSGITPEVPGITDVETFDDWDEPFEMDKDRITDRDNDYWGLYRATPKLFVSTETAHALWESRFGEWTSVRMASEAPGNLPNIVQRLEVDIPASVDLSAIGLTFQASRADGLAAATGASDFSVLFLGFSFFLIASAALLIALVFRLGMQTRTTEMGLMAAIGFRPRRIRAILLTEGMVLAIVGIALGIGAGIGFAWAMLYGLTHWWIGAVGTTDLQLDVRPNSLIIAAAGSVILAALVLWQATGPVRRVSARSLLLSGVDDNGTDQRKPSRGFWKIIRVGAIISTIAVAVGLPALLLTDRLPNKEAFFGMSWQVIGFFLVGMSWLVLSLLFLAWRLRVRAGAGMVWTGLFPRLQLATANASRNTSRSMMTTALIAFATFVVVAVTAGRRDPQSETPELHSGNGGFLLVAESSQPLLYDLNTGKGRLSLGFAASAKATNDDAAEPVPGERPAFPSGTRVFGFPLRRGDDASCLNLFQTRVPTILGASDAFIERGGFRFVGTPGDNPWELLRESPIAEDGIPILPVIGDLNTLQFGLKKGIGDEIAVPDETNPQVRLRIVGMLDSSVFQGVLVGWDVNFHNAFPDISGEQYFLIENDDDQSLQAIADRFETVLSPYGFDTESVVARIANFLSVQNTYLATFRLLGALGLLLGTFGLATVMMRNVLERRKEFALMKAVGFTGRRIGSLILAENNLLLFWGILTGTGSALLAMMPHLQSRGADIPWTTLGITLGVILLTGMAASLLAVRAASSTSVREGLAGE